jgi:hypothetical protein
MVRALVRVNLKVGARDIRTSAQTKPGAARIGKAAADTAEVGPVANQSAMHTVLVRN